MNEADYKRKLVGEINALPGGYAARIEDRYRVGALDLIIKLPTYPILWAEGKIVEGNLFAPTPRQWQEGQEIQNAGMLVLLLGWKRIGAGQGGNCMFVSPWVQKADIRTCIYGGSPWLTPLLNYLKGI